MALLNCYISDTIFNNKNKCWKKEEDVNNFFCDRTKFLKCDSPNYKWLIVDTHYKKGLIKLLRYFISQEYLVSKDMYGRHDVVIYFLMRIIKIYKVNYYFDYIKNLVINYVKNIEDVEIIIEHYSTCGTIRKVKLLEIIESIPDKPITYYERLIQSCSGNNIQLIDYFYKKTPFEFLTQNDKKIMCTLLMDSLCFNLSIKQIKWVFEHVIYKHMSELAKESICSMCGYACSHGRIDIIKWLVKKNTSRMLPETIYAYTQQLYRCNNLINENKVAKIITNHFIKSNNETPETPETPETQGTPGIFESFKAPTIQMLIAFEQLISLDGYLNNVRTLKKLLLFEQQKVADIGNHSIHKLIIKNLFKNRINNYEYSNKLFNIYFKMFVKCGIFKVDSNNRIVSTTIKNYVEFIGSIYSCVKNNDRKRLQISKFEMITSECDDCLYEDYHLYEDDCLYENGDEFFYSDD